MGLNGCLTNDFQRVKQIYYPTAFLCTIGQPQPFADLQFVKVTVIKNNNKSDIWLTFFIIIIKI